MSGGFLQIIVQKNIHLNLKNHLAEVVKILLSGKKYLDFTSLYHRSDPPGFFQKCDCVKVLMDKIATQ